MIDGIQNNKNTILKMNEYVGLQFKNINVISMEVFVQKLNTKT